MPAIEKKQELGSKNLESGSTVLFVAVVIMAFLVMVAFLLDIAGGLMLRNRLQTMADNGTDAGMNALSDLILAKALAHDPNPPDGTDPRSVLTDDDYRAILTDGRASIEPMVNDYIAKNPLPPAIIVKSTDIEYPNQQQINCAQPNQRQVELRVTIKATQPMLFEKIWNRSTNDLQASSWQTMNLCP